MRVLVACEFSGIVREAFAARGHDAWSCDLLPADVYGGQWHSHHLQGDVRQYLRGLKTRFNRNPYEPWDLMIAHPPCTYLCSSGLHWNKRRPGRDQLTDEAIAFVHELLDAPIPHIALENPIGCISSRIRKPDQIIQPWQFGHPESKATCLWLKKLPPLKPSNVLPKPESGRWSNQTPSGQNKLGPRSGAGLERWKARALTYTGIAEAMADQWSESALFSHQNSRTATAAESRGAWYTPDIIPIVTASGQVMPRTTDTNSLRNRESSTEYVELPPSPEVVMRILSGR